MYSPALRILKQQFNKSNFALRQSNDRISAICNILQELTQGQQIRITGKVHAPSINITYYVACADTGSKQVCT